MCGGKRWPAYRSLWRFWQGLDGGGGRWARALTFALRYSDLGRVETDRGAMQMNHVPAGIVINPTRAELRSHGVMIGLRYAL